MILERNSQEISPFRYRKISYANRYPNFPQNGNFSIDSRIRRSTFYVHPVHKDFYYTLKLFSTLLAQRTTSLTFYAVNYIAESAIPWHVPVIYAMYTIYTLPALNINLFCKIMPFP